MFKNGLRGKTEKKKKSAKYPIPQTVFDFGGKSSLWNNAFERTWKSIQSRIDVQIFYTFKHRYSFSNNSIFIFLLQKIQANNNDDHLNELCNFVTKGSSSSNDNVKNANMTLLPVAALMTGINKPDHYEYFKLLSSTMSKKKIARTVFLPARDCPNVRTAIETLVSSILNNGRKHNYKEEKNAVR